MLETLRNLRDGKPLPEDMGSKELELIGRFKLKDNTYCHPDEISRTVDSHSKGEKRPESTTISAGIYDIRFGEEEKKKIIAIARGFKARGSKDPLKDAVEQFCSTYAEKYSLSEKVKEQMIKQVMDWLR